MEFVPPFKQSFLKWSGKMKSIKLVLVVFVAISFCCILTATAQDGGGEKKGGGGGGGGGGGWIGRYDSDGNGEVSLKEYKDYFKNNEPEERSISRLDTDGDGTLSKEEIAASFSERDADGNGVIAGDEGKGNKGGGGGGGGREK